MHTLILQVNHLTDVEYPKIFWLPWQFPENAPVCTQNLILLAK
jgi:hypothetical protein